MKMQSESGWLMSLSSMPESDWGGVESFLASVEDSEEADGYYVLESDVWGKLNTKDALPLPGQGIAFYHSTRAEFPENDRFGRKPRVTLIGQLLDIETEGKEVTHIKVKIEKSLLSKMKTTPIVRNEETSAIFEGCGIKRGAVATFYYADPEHWKSLVSLLRARA